MKNQYFGDTRDLFKYDLIKHILGNMDGTQRFTYVPMLTEDKPKNREGKPGSKNQELVVFLDKYKDKKRKKFTVIRKYFESQGIEVDIYNYKKSKYFCKEIRADYFKNIPEEYQINPLIFIDPDTGLKPDSSKEKEQYLLYDEVKLLYDHMAKNSILMIYQHFPRDRNCTQYLPKGRADKLEKMCKIRPLHISDNNIFFLFLTKTNGLEGLLKNTLKAYQEKYPKTSLK